MYKVYIFVPVTDHYLFKDFLLFLKVQIFHVVYQLILDKKKNYYKRNNKIFLGDFIISHHRKFHDSLYTIHEYFSSSD